RRAAAVRQGRRKRGPGRCDGRVRLAQHGTGADDGACVATLAGDRSTAIAEAGRCLVAAARAGDGRRRQRRSVPRRRSPGRLGRVAMSALRERTLQVGEVRTPAIEAGPGEATEAVVFVHGNPGSSTDWTGLVQSAGELGRAVAFDMPGFGKAPAPGRFGYDVAAYAQFVGEALAALGIERVHLVVHDFGGPF